MKPALVFPVLMTALIGLSFSCSKSDPASEVFLPQEPEFRDVNRTMEDWIPLEAEGNYHNYFRFQNASDHTFYFNVSTKYGSEPFVTYIRPGEQGTDLITLAKAPLTGLTDALITDLSLMGWITFWVNAPAPGNFRPSWAVGRDNNVIWPMIWIRWRSIRFTTGWNTTAKKQRRKTLHAGRSSSLTITAFAGRTVSRTRIMGWLFGRRSNDGPRKMTKSSALSSE